MDSRPEFRKDWTGDPWAAPWKAGYIGLFVTDCIFDSRWRHQPATVCPYGEPRRTSLYSEEKEPSGGLRFLEDGACLGWRVLVGVGVSRRGMGDQAWHLGSRPEVAWPPEKLHLSEHNASSASGLSSLNLARVLETRSLGPQSLSEQGQGQRQDPEEDAPSGWVQQGLVLLVARNKLFAVPGVGEDEPVIIFKFAIIDLGKSYCDKNELIIKFISEINSATIKQLAGAAEAAGGPAFLAAKSPRQARTGSAGGRGVGQNNYVFPGTPLPPEPSVEGQNPR